MNRRHPARSETIYYPGLKINLTRGIQHAPAAAAQSRNTFRVIPLSVATEFIPTINHQIPYADTVIERYVSPSGWIRTAGAGFILPRVVLPNPGNSAPFHGSGDAHPGRESSWYRELITPQHPITWIIPMNTLEDQEAQNIRGGLGVLETILVGVVVGSALNIINNWDSFKAGLLGYPDPAAKQSAK